MSQPPNNQDDDLQPLMRRMEDEFGRPSHEPIQGEAQPVAPPTYHLRLPLGTPRAVWVLLAINLAIFALPLLLAFLGARIDGVRIDDYILALGAKSNPAIRRGEYHRLLTAMFLHGGLLHIGFNTYALYALGPESERIYGTPRFLTLYFIAGLAGNVASYALTPRAAVGASGAIFGLIGGLGAFYYASRQLLGNTARQQLGSLITIIMINLFIGFSSPQIDNIAHIGGLIGGALAGWALAPRFEIDERLFPPTIARRDLALAWPAALALLALLAALAILIDPP